MSSPLLPTALPAEDSLPASQHACEGTSCRCPQQPAATRPIAARPILPLLLALALAATWRILIGYTSTSTSLHPVIFFPGFSASRLKVTVVNQTFSTSCPPSAEFEFHAGHVPPWGFGERCIFESLKILRNDSHSLLHSRFTNQLGVTVQVASFGSLLCSPFYSPLYFRLIAAGYVAGHNLFAACYDFRTVPPVDLTGNHTFIAAAKQLVEDAYEKGGRRRGVYLMGHSNGVMMAMALLQSQTKEWIENHISGLVSFAGNWAGQGITTRFIFSGISFTDFVSLRPYASLSLSSWPAIYATLPQPAIFSGEKDEVVVRAGSAEYRVSDLKKLFRDAKLSFSSKLDEEFNDQINVTSLRILPRILACYGSRIPTKVGIILDNLEQGAYIKEYLWAVGDGDQESIDNEAILLWKGETKGLLEIVNLGFVRHFLVPFSPLALQKALTMLQEV